MHGQLAQHFALCSPKAIHLLPGSGLGFGYSSSSLASTDLLMGDSVEAECKQTDDVYNSDKIVG